MCYFAMAACEKAERSATACQWLKHFTFLEETVLVLFCFFLHEFGGKSNARVTLSHRAVKTWPCKRGQEKKMTRKGMPCLCGIDGERL